MQLIWCYCLSNDIENVPSAQDDSAIAIDIAGNIIETNAAIATSLGSFPLNAL
jgi:hypothetical protein